MIRELRRFIREPVVDRMVRAFRASQAAPACDGGPRRQTLEMFIVTLGAAVLLGLAGAFGTGEWPIGLRLLYWLISMGGGYGVAIVSYDLIHHAMRRFERPLVAMALYVVLGTPLIAVFVWFVAPLLFHSDLTLLSFLAVLWPILMINIALLALKGLMARQSVIIGSSPIASPSRVRLHDRLPAAFQIAQIRAVSAEDHYLRIYTDLGEVLVLMRLRNAVQELEGIEGAQIHRSWWVAKNAVERIIKDNRRCDLLLKGNVRAPVSRSYRKMLRDNGWV